VATLKPFYGLRYDPAKIGDLAHVVAPPYDVIDSASQEQLYARSPYNAVRLILNRDRDPYGAAAAILADWRTRGVLAADPTPALYLYAQRFAVPGGGELERAGVIGALRLERFDSGRVRPHERTLQRAKDDRLALLRACRTSLSPIFGLVSAPAWHFGELVPARAPDIELRDDTGAHHRVWRLADPPSVAAIAERLEGKDVFIADGHHRYETALRYRDEVRAALGASAPPPGSARYDYMLAYLTTMEDPGLLILPTHRVLHSLPLAPAALRAALATCFTVEDVPWTEEGTATLLARLQRYRAHGRETAGDPAPEVRIGAAVEGAGALWLLSAATAALPLPAELPPALKALDVTALHQVVLAGVLGLPIGERGGTPGLSYTQDAQSALALVAAGKAAAAFFLPPTDVDDLRAVALAGLTMPEKSTFFYPKLLTGLVIYPVAAPEGAAAGAGTP
jgi:uncharacterized protein (DUF1015 family)